MGYYTAVPAMVVVALAATIIALAATSAESFLPAAPVLAAPPQGTAARRTGMGGRGGALRMKYVPDGLTPEQWKKMQAKEADKKKKMDLGYVGVKGFKSRSLQAWQEAGSGHLFPVNPKKVCRCVSCVHVFVPLVPIHRDATKTMCVWSWQSLLSRVCAQQYATTNRIMLHPVSNECIVCRLTLKSLNQIVQLKSSLFRHRFFSL